VDAPDDSETAVVLIASLGTTPFMRHSPMTTNAFCALDDLTGGRAVPRRASGGGKLLAAGRMRATHKQMRTEIAALPGHGDPLETIRGLATAREAW